MKKSGLIILTLFSIFFINALVKEKEFLGPDSSEAASALQEDETLSCDVISTLSLWGYKRIALSDNTTTISGESAF